MGEKAGDVEVKINLQPPFGIRKIDSRCPRGYRLLVKKDKDDTNWEHRDGDKNKDKNKAKSHNFSSTN